MAEKRWFWATLTLSSITIVSVVFAAWELAENRFFRYANYATLHYLYITRGIVSSLLLAFWAAWFVLRQRRKSEDDLRRSRERYRGLLEAFPGAVVLYDSALQVLEWNASAERMYGYARAEVIGRPLPIVPAAKAYEVDVFLRRVDRAGPVLDIETLRQPKGGDPFEVQLSLLPFREAAGPLYFLEVTSDIRERVRWREHMLQIEKLTSMGKMAAGTAHHLNSPLAALLMRVQMMRQRPIEPAFDQDMARIEEGLNFCRHFVQRLLEFTRAMPIQKAPQELTAIVESVSSFFMPAVLSRRASLQVDASEARGAHLLADRNLMETLLLILLSNALDAIQPGGEIVVRCRKPAGGRVGFAVSDNGSGIAAKDLEKVFEPFFTTKEPGKGTGLGLAIARNVVLEHGGTIHMESTPGVGTTAYVDLPLAPATEATETEKGGGMKTGNEPRGAGILVVDDDASLAATLKEFLAGEGYNVEMAQSAAEALAVHAANPHISLALVDLIMPVTDGLALTDELRRRNPDITVVIMTGYGTIETAVDAIKRGAEDYVTKPFDYEAVRKKVARLMEVNELRERVSQLEKNLERHPSFENIISLSPGMERVIERARLASGTDASVLILGETGTGKEMLARAIHAASSRARMPFVALNSGALPHDLVESELFGFRKGAFTGAHADAPGLFSAASGGTVFLDELGEMPKDVQVKLLRVLQEREVRPVGGTQTVHVDVRVVAATNRTLTELRSTFLREDLYFRIATILLEVPPLRDRPEDTLVLAQHFATRVSRRYGREISLSRPALELLLRYGFPGNVRELENLVESAAAVSEDNPQTITDKDLKPLMGAGTPAPAIPAAMNEALSMEQMEKLTIQQALRVSEGNRTKAASLLGISRDTLYRKLRHYQV